MKFLCSGSVSMSSQRIEAMERQDLVCMMHEIAAATIDCGQFHVNLDIIVIFVFYMVCISKYSSNYLPTHSKYSSEAVRSLDCFAYGSNADRLKWAAH